MQTQRAFTVIELLVVLAAVAVLLSIAAPRYMAHLDRAQETALRHNLKVMREAIDQYRADKGHAPASLQDLVSARYLREVPEDPITQRRDTWVAVSGVQQEAAPAISPLPAVGLLDVHSGAPGAASDGTAYASW